MTNDLSHYLMEHNEYKSHRTSLMYEPMDRDPHLLEHNRDKRDAKRVADRYDGRIREHHQLYDSIDHNHDRDWELAEWERKKRKVEVAYSVDRKDGERERIEREGGREEGRDRERERERGGGRERERERGRERERERERGLIDDWKRYRLTDIPRDRERDRSRGRDSVIDGPRAMGTCRAGSTRHYNYHVDEYEYRMLRNGWVVWRGGGGGSLEVVRFTQSVDTKRERERQPLDYNGNRPNDLSVYRSPCDSEYSRYTSGTIPIHSLHIGPDPLSHSRSSNHNHRSHVDRGHRHDYFPVEQHGSTKPPIEQRQYEPAPLDRAIEPRLHDQILADQPYSPSHPHLDMPIGHMPPTISGIDVKDNHANTSGPIGEVSDHQSYTGLDRERSRKTGVIADQSTIKPLTPIGPNPVNITTLFPSNLVSIGQKMNPPYDCALIVLNREQRFYADMVVNRIKDVGLDVEEIFLENKPINDELRRLVSLGVPMACAIAPSDEVANTVSIFFLTVVPFKEHRQLQLKDAIELMTNQIETLRSHGNSLNLSQSNST
eukprot:Ihof_evm5s185 gene=Ihof_evmTU5s185